MAPMCSADLPALAPAHRQVLLEIARGSVAHGLECDRELPVQALDYAPELQAPRASFVTLKLREQLRGCMGSAQAHRPLVEDVAHNAYAAGFHDPRFPPLTRAEARDLDYHISILSPWKQLRFTSEADLLAHVRPGVDGLLLEEGFSRGILLPAVWESLPDPETFVRHLKLKAGLSETHWSDSIRVSHCTAESIP